MAITSKTGQPTSKSKPALAPKMGVSLRFLEEREICWVPLPQDEELQNLLMDVANARTTDPKDRYPNWLVPASYLLKLMEDPTVIAELKKEAARSSRQQIGDMSLEELEKEEARAIARAQKMAEAKAKLMALQTKAPKK